MAPLRNLDPRCIMPVLLVRLISTGIRLRTCSRSAFRSVTAVSALSRVPPLAFRVRRYLNWGVSSCWLSTSPLMTSPRAYIDVVIQVPWRPRTSTTGGGCAA